MTDFETQIQVPVITEFIEFANVRVFGTAETPLFVAKDVEQMLQIKHINYNRDYVETEDYVKIKIQYDSQTREVNAFTEHGLYQVIYRTRSPVGDKFRKFVTLVLKELRINKVVTLETALGKLEVQLEEEHAKVLNFQRASERFYDKLTNAQIKLCKAEEDLKSATAWGKGSAEYKLQCFRERYFKPLYIYLVKIPKQCEDEIDSYDMDDDVADSDHRVWTISFSKKEKEENAMLYVPPKLTLTALESHLDSVKLKEVNHRYHCSIDDLREIIDELI